MGKQCLYIYIYTHIYMRVHIYTYNTYIYIYIYNTPRPSICTLYTLDGDHIPLFKGHEEGPGWYLDYCQYSLEYQQVAPKPETRDLLTLESDYFSHYIPFVTISTINITTVIPSMTIMTITFIVLPVTTIFAKALVSWRPLLEGTWTLVSFSEL